MPSACECELQEENPQVCLLIALCQPVPTCQGGQGRHSPRRADCASAQPWALAVRSWERRGPLSHRCSLSPEGHQRPPQQSMAGVGTSHRAASETDVLTHTHAPTNICIHICTHPYPQAYMKTHTHTHAPGLQESMVTSKGSRAQTPCFICVARASCSSQPQFPYMSSGDNSPVTVRNK